MPQIRCQSSFLASTPPPTPIPAFEQNRSMGPKASVAFSTSASMSASTDTSVETASAWAPISPATLVAPSASRSAITTARAPSAAKRRDRAAPMPLAPPVTTQTLSLSSMAGDSMSDCRPGPLGLRSASDRRVLELVEVGPSRDEVDGALDRLGGEPGIAARAVHEPDEHGLVVGDERRHPEHPVVGDGTLVLLAERLERPTLGDGLEDRRRVDALLLEDPAQHGFLADVAALVVAGREQRAVDLEELLGRKPVSRHDPHLHGQQRRRPAPIVPDIPIALFDRRL